MRKMVLVAMLLVLTTSVGYCQDQLLQLTIKADKDVYKVGENLIGIKFVLKNTGDKDIYPYYVLHDAYLVINGKQTALTKGLTWRTSSESCVAPNTDYLYGMNIKNIYSMDKIGQYSLFLKYKNLVSNTITIQVVENIIPSNSRDTILNS